MLQGVERSGFDDIQQIILTEAEPDRFTEVPVYDYAA
jgi:hypothetical protein